VENTTDEDWNHVSLGLISGRPISFQMDLYEPLYVSRPIVEPELFASLRPQTYSGDLGTRTLIEEKREASSQLKANRVRLAKEPMFERAGRSPTTHALGLTPEAAKDAEKPMNLREGVSSAAVATELGEYFQYQIEQPVSLPRQKSALLPIVNQPVEAARVS